MIFFYTIYRFTKTIMPHIINKRIDEYFSYNQNSDLSDDTLEKVDQMKINISTEISLFVLFECNELCAYLN